MRITAILAMLVLLPAGSFAQTPRRTSGPATLVVTVTDQAGGPVSDVRVTLQGPIAREARTEQGRLVFEGLPSGSYRMRFQRDGFQPFERDVAARGGTPIDVKVELTREAAPKPPPPPLTPVMPLVDAETVTLDIPTYIEKNFVGRAAGKTSLLACAAGGEATLLQLRSPLAEQTHTAADEYLYVIAGEGTAQTGKTLQPLRAGVFMLVPRGVSHSLSATGRSPLVVISIKAGEKCSPPGVGQ